MILLNTLGLRSTQECLGEPDVSCASPSAAWESSIVPAVHHKPESHNWSHHLEWELCNSSRWGFIFRQIYVFLENSEWVTHKWEKEVVVMRNVHRELKPYPLPCQLETSWNKGGFWPTQSSHGLRQLLSYFMLEPPVEWERQMDSILTRLYNRLLWAHPHLSLHHFTLIIGWKWKAVFFCFCFFNTQADS